VPFDIIQRPAVLLATGEILEFPKVLTSYCANDVEEIKQITSSLKIFIRLLFIY
jgi:hypothetical protein